LGRRERYFWKCTLREVKVRGLNGWARSINGVSRRLRRFLSRQIRRPIVHPRRPRTPPYSRRRNGPSRRCERWRLSILTCLIGQTNPSTICGFRRGSGSHHRKAWNVGGPRLVRNVQQIVPNIFSAICTARCVPLIGVAARRPTWRSLLSRTTRARRKIVRRGRQEHLMFFAKPEKSMDNYGVPRNADEFASRL